MAPSESTSKAEPPSPVLCIWHEEQNGDTISRCFTNWPLEDTKQLTALIRTAMPLDTLIRPHDYYVAVQWKHDSMQQQYKCIDGMTEHVHELLRDLVDLHFGWRGSYTMQRIFSLNQLQGAARGTGMTRREWVPGWR